MRKLAYIACLFMLWLPAPAQRNILSDISTRARAQMVPGQRDLRLQPGAVAGSYKLFVLTSENAFPLNLDSAQLFGVSKQFAIHKVQIAARSAFMSLSSLRASSLTGADRYGVIQLTDPNRTGNYRLRLGDNTTPDNGGTILVDGAGNRYELDHPGEVAVTKFGAIPDDGIDDTDAFRRAAASGVPLLVTNGEFIISDSIAVINKGNFRIRGQSMGAIIRMNADKNLFVYQATSNAGGTIDVRDLTLWAGVNMTKGTAIKILGKYQRKIGEIHNVHFTRPDLTKEWYRGIYAKNANELVVQNCDFSGNNTAKFVAVDFEADQATISSTLTNVKVYDAFIGARGRTSTTPGLEGTKFTNCDFVGVFDGVNFENSVSPYQPPGLQFQTCHFNASNEGIHAQGYAQGSITSSIFYHFGTGYGAAIYLNNAYQFEVSGNFIRDVGGGSSFHGVLANNGANGQLSIHHNKFDLPVANVTAVWLGTTTNYSKVTDNEAVGGLNAAQSLYFNQGGVTNEIKRNTPAGSDDVVTQSIASLRASVFPAGSAPKLFSPTDKGRSGTFVLDASDQTSADNTGSVLVSGSGERYKRQLDGPLNVEKFGVVYGRNQSQATRVANADALTKAANSKVDVYFKGDSIEVYGKIKATNVPVTMHGAGSASAIIQFMDDSLLVLDQRSGQYPVLIEDIAFLAGLKMNKGVALSVLNYPVMPPNDPVLSKPFGQLNRLYFYGSDAYRTRSWTNDWKTSIAVTNANRMTFNNILINGATGGKTDGTTGMDITATRAAIENLVHDVHIYQVTTAISMQSGQYPGNEGWRYDKCTAAGVWDGFVFGGSGYQPPLWSVTNCHISAAHNNVYIYGGSQGRIKDNLFYNVGNSGGAADAPAFITFADAAQQDVSGNQCFVVQGDAYGVLIKGAGPDNLNSFMRFQNNDFYLKTGTDKPGIWAQNPVEYSLFAGNRLFRSLGSSVLISHPASHDNQSYDNTPYRTFTYSTASWSAGSYTTVINPGVLEDNKTYDIKIRYEQPGTTILTQVFTLAGNSTYSGTGLSQNTLPMSWSDFNGSANHFDAKLIGGGSTLGVSLSPSASMNGTLTVTLIPRP